MYQQYSLFDPPKLCTKCGVTKAESEFRKKHGKTHWPCLECHRFANNEYARLNAEKVSRRKQRWYQDNFEHCQKLSKANYLANRERLLEQSSIRQRLNSERVNARNREWARNNREKVRLYQKRSHQNNPETRRRIDQRYRARKHDAPGEGASLAQLITEHGPLCYLCKADAATEVDHVIPLSKGGTNYPHNLRPACTFCNRSKRDKILEVNEEWP